MQLVVYIQDLPKTLAWMKKNWDFAIDQTVLDNPQHDNVVFDMRGYSIVGDGTTPQLTAMLTGKPTTDFYTGDGTGKIVDTWPFFFKDAVDQGKMKKENTTHYVKGTSHRGWRINLLWVPSLCD